jgi:hypothetical protein
VEIVEGNIVRVMESWPLQLVVDTPSGRLGVLLTEETKIMEGGRSAGSNALLPGEKVRLAGRSKTGRPETFLAAEIHVNPPEDE